MNAAEVKVAARNALSRYFAKGAEETSTRDYTAVVYPDLQSVIVQWVEERKNGKEIERNRVFKIDIGAVVK
jgi:hypothetical protein